MIKNNEAGLQQQTSPNDKTTHHNPNRQEVKYYNE